MIRAHLALGSNLGDRLAHLQGAVDGIAAAAGVAVVAISGVYETAPVGGPQQDDFLNAVVAVDTTLDPYSLLDLAQRLEQEARRVRAERWGPRTLDVDVLLYGECRLDDPLLTIPHPRMYERDFVMAPLAEVAAGFAGAPQHADGIRRTDLPLRGDGPPRDAGGR